MNRLLWIILVLFLLMSLLTRIDFAAGHAMPESVMALGFTLISAYLVGLILSRFSLPKITGYIIAGIFSGPYLINLLSIPVVKNLQLINNIALSLIALTAGGEFRLKKVRKQLKTIGSVILWQIIIVMAGFIIFTLFYGNKISFLENQSFYVILGTGILFGSLSIATSPATTIAIITETHSKGTFTEFILGVTVFKDILVVLIFSIGVALAAPMIVGESQIQFDYILSVLFEIAVSIIFGFIAGVIIILYFKYVQEQTVLFLLGFIILGIELAAIFHLEVVLLFMIAGFFVQNYSDLGSHLIDAIEEISLPIFVIFFAIAGASLNLNIFFQNWFLAIIIVVLRLLSTFGGTYLGGKLTNSPSTVKKYGWLGFIGQAGLTLGLAILVKQKIPGEIGIGISTLIIASIAINQIIGPVLFRYALIKVGEAKESN